MEKQIERGREGERGTRCSLCQWCIACCGYSRNISYFKSKHISRVINNSHGDREKKKEVGLFDITKSLLKSLNYYAEAQDL